MSSSASEVPKSEILRGLVERVTFHNDDTGYCILKVLRDQ